MGKKRKKLFGIDVGATGIKGAIVDLNTGEFLTERIKFPTPQPATPDACATVIRQIGRVVGCKKGALVGCGFPSVVLNGVTLSAANIDESWIGFDAQKFLSAKTGYKVALVNDADAAGIAEVRFGHIQKTGTVILLTLGTGIGSALFYNGKLVPNTELGHIPYKRSIAEDYVSNRARKQRKMSVHKWACNLNEYLKHINRIITPELIILGGGISRRFTEYSQYIDPGVKVVPAEQLNNAGITGAALYADMV
jgi:polyphosphate glucokinase